MAGFRGVQTSEHLGLDFLETRQGLFGRPEVVGQLFLQGDGVTHLGGLQFFDARNDVAHLARFKGITRFIGRGEHTQVVGVVDRFGGHHLETLTFAQASIHHPHQHDDAHVGVKPAVDNHGSQGRIRIAFGCGNFGHHSFQNILHAHAGFGRAGNRIRGVDADDVFNLCFGVVRIGLRQIHFVEHRHHLHTQVEGGVAIGHGLRFDALAGIHHQECAFTSRQRTTHLIREVDMPRCIDQIQVVNLAIAGLVLQRSGLRLDGYPTLFLNVHRVQHLRFHLTVAQSAAALNDAVCQRGFAVVNVRDDRKISDVVHQCKQLSV